MTGPSRGNRQGSRMKRDVFLDLYFLKSHFVSHVGDI